MITGQTNPPMLLLEARGVNPIGGADVADGVVAGSLTGGRTMADGGVIVGTSVVGRVVDGVVGGVVDGVIGGVVVVVGPPKSLPLTSMRSPGTPAVPDSRSEGTSEASACGTPTETRWGPTRYQGV